MMHTSSSSLPLLVLLGVMAFELLTLLFDDNALATMEGCDVAVAALDSVAPLMKYDDWEGEDNKLLYELLDKVVGLLVLLKYDDWGGDDNKVYELYELYELFDLFAPFSQKGDP